MDVNTITQARDDIPEIIKKSTGMDGGGRVATDSAQGKPETKDQTKVSDKEAENIAKSMNQLASVFNTELSFSVDKDTHKTVIKVVDKGTGEVIRQIPPEETLRLMSKMKNVMGMLYNAEI
jgi:flagellar protein FlaG